jgi:hypothetical protein
MNELATEQLADLITKRRLCLMKLRDLGRKQTELIAAGEMGALLRSFTAKNQWIVAVQAIEKELAPFHAQDPDERDWASSMEREQCAQQANDCQSLLDEIMQLERENEQRMTERRDQVAQQLQSAHAAGAARAAYQAQQTRGPVYSQPLPLELPTANGQLDLQSNA